MKLPLPDQLKMPSALQKYDKLHLLLWHSRAHFRLVAVAPSTEQVNNIYLVVGYHEAATGIDFGQLRLK